MYKTKIIAIITILFGFFGLILGKLDPTEAWKIMLAGAGAFSFRDAMK